jgi:hypothetical protein
MAQKKRAALRPAKITLGRPGPREGLAGSYRKAYQQKSFGRAAMAGMRQQTGGEYACSCGAVYKVTITTTPFPDTDSESCEVCGKLIKSWRAATSWPSYELIKRPEGRYRVH